MAEILYDQGEQLFREVIFTDAELTGPFYIGLGEGFFPPNDSATLSDVIEVSGTNYSRIAVARDEDGWTPINASMSTDVLEWHNLDPAASWTPAEYAFLTLSPSGQDEPNILISAVDLPKTIILGPTQVASMMVRFKFASRTT